jgi:hypothetical protein
MSCKKYTVPLRRRRERWDHEKASTHKEDPNSIAFSSMQILVSSCYIFASICFPHSDLNYQFQAATTTKHVCCVGWKNVFCISYCIWYYSHNMKNRCLLVLVVVNRHLKSIFKNKKIDPDRSLTCCHPRRPSLGCAGREEPPSLCAWRRSRHQGRQWSPSPCAVEEARSRSVSIRLCSGSICTAQPRATIADVYPRCCHRRRWQRGGSHCLASIRRRSTSIHADWHRGAPPPPAQRKRGPPSRSRAREGCRQGWHCGGHERGHPTWEWCRRSLRKGTTSGEGSRRRAGHHAESTAVQPGEGGADVDKDGVTTAEVPL